MEDIVRVLRIIEYTGPRDKVEKQVARSIHGPIDFGNGVVIRAGVVGDYPEILFAHEVLERGSKVPEVPRG